MRTSIVSLIFIGLALAAIVGGYVSGEASTRPPAFATVRPTPAPSVSAVLRDASDGPVIDAFTDDDVVVERETSAAQWKPERLSVVIGLCGTSAPVEAQFLRLGEPVALDVDPHAPDADRVAQFARTAGATLLIHVTSSPSRATLDELEQRFGAIDGVASRQGSGMARALAGSRLLFFDERGDMDDAPFAAAKVRLVHRDATVDDRSAPAYVHFMLQRAAMRSRLQGRLVVLMRPLPNSLDAFERFLGTRSAQIVALTQPA